MSETTTERHRTSRTDGALYSKPRRSGRRRKCDGHLSEPHHIDKGDLIVWSSLPPDNPEIGNTTWWHAVFCMDCAPTQDGAR